MQVLIMIHLLPSHLFSSSPRTLVWMSVSSSVGPRTSSSMLWPHTRPSSSRSFRRSTQSARVLSSTPFSSQVNRCCATQIQHINVAWSMGGVTGCARIMLHAVCYLHSVLTRVHHFVHWCCVILPLHCKKQAEFCIIILLLLLLLLLKWKKWTCSKLTLGWVSIEMTSLMTPHPSWSNDCNDRKTLIICWWVRWEMRLINKRGQNHTWIEWNLHSCWNCLQRDCSSGTLWQHTCNNCDIKYTHPSLLRNADRVDQCPQSVPKITPEPVCFGRFFCALI